MTALPRPARGSGGASGSQTPLLTCVVTQTPRPPLGDRGLAAAPVSPRVCLTLLRRAQGPTPCGPSCVTTAGGCSGRGHGRVTQSRSSSRGRAPRGPVLPAGTPCSLALASQPRPWRPWDSGACGGVLTCLSPSPGHANASFCPHGYGCRTLVVCEGQTVLDVTDGELTVTVRVPEGRWLWLVSPETGVPVWGRPAPARGPVACTPPPVTARACAQPAVAQPCAGTGSSSLWGPPGPSHEASEGHQEPRCCPSALGALLVRVAFLEEAGPGRMERGIGGKGGPQGGRPPPHASQVPLGRRGQPSLWVPDAVPAGAQTRL